MVLHSLRYRNLAAGVIAVATFGGLVVTSADADPRQRSHVDIAARLSHKVVSSSSPISMRSAGANSEVLIATSSNTPQYSVQRLANPDRLVIDLEGEQLPSGTRLEASGVAYVSGVRVGAHPRKSRVVIDLKGAQEIGYEATVDNSTIVVRLLPKTTSTASLPTASVNAERAQPSPQIFDKATSNAKRTALVLDEEMIVSGSSSSEKTLADVKQANGESKQGASESVATEARVEAATTVPQLAMQKDTKKEPATLGASGQKSVVQSVALNGQETQPSIVIGLKGSIDYSISRTAPSEYVVTLRNAIADEQLLKKTLFTAKSGSGIRSVRTTKDGDDVLVRVFTQPSSYLTTKKLEDRVVIEETQDLTQIARDIRAQLAPPSAGDAPQKDPAKSSPPDADPKKAPVGTDATKADAAKGGAIKSSDPKADPAKKSPDVLAKRLGGDKQGAPAGEKKEGPVPSMRSEGELAAIRGDSGSYTGRLISLDLQDADIDSALRIIAEVSNLNIVAGEGVVGKVTLKLVDVPWDQALDVILKNASLDKVLEGNVLRVAPLDKLKAERESLKQARVAEEELEPLSVKYMRISYAKASEIKSLVETVLTERGTVAFDERSNQLVVKDVPKGLQNVSELIRKVDLRTPQILLETQIIEANRNLSRQLGSELGFQYIQSPATGNGTGLNFPSAIALGGSVDPTNQNSITGSAFPIATSATAGSAITMLFDSADGTKNLQLRLTQLEQEGQVRIISRPAVATTNNKPAEIKSVEKYRVKLPNGGLSIATGSGAQSSGAGNVATQTIEAGIVLNVTPQASPDYYILLDINAKSSSFGSQKVDGIPNEIERSASSSVLVSSGQTFALGGIYKITESDSITGVPFFKDIPVLGTFFRSSVTENKDEELLFFITPRIVEGSFEDASMKVVS